MNTIVNRRREYNKIESIKLPDGYKVAKYFDCKSDVMVSKTVPTPRTSEALIEPDITKSNRIMFGRNGHAPAGFSGTKAIMGSASSVGSFFDANEKVIFKVIHAGNNGSKVYVDDIDTRLSGTCGHGNLGIFGDSAYTLSGFYGKVYWVKIYKSGALIHHIIPCKKGDISAAFDLITNSFVTPTSGSFHVV